MATSTVEDYLKCVYLEQERSAGAVVSPGRIAQALGVAPGTVTAMMKTLTESKLVDYEPYAGVRLTPAGQRLATHVLRRHRLIELFLVRIMGMDWSEVHQDAEVLEHAISERLLERMDEILGRPSVDPHGDPIPTAAGTIASTASESLFSCALEQSVRIARVTDQRAAFLRLLEQHGLKPGEIVSVESRNELAETVSVRCSTRALIQLDFRAASRVLVEEI